MVGYYSPGIELSLNRVAAKMTPSASVFQKAANVAHKATVTGLVGLFAYGAYNLTGQVLEGSGRSDKDATKAHPQAGFIKTIRDRAAEEYAKYYDIDHREWYDKDDDSFLKKVPRAGKDYQEK